MVGCNCAGTVHGVNGGTDQRVTCSIANCSAENHISAEAARLAGLDLVALEQQAGLTDILGNTTSADSLARNVRISLLDADGQWVEFVLPTVIVLQTPMNPNCQFTLGQPFFKYRGLSLTAQGMGTRREWNDPDMVWFPEDPQLQEDPNVAYLGISQWQEGTRPKTCTVCGLEFPGLKACGRCVAEATPRAQRPRYCSRDCQRQHWRAEHRAFHQERNMTIAAALGRDTVAGALAVALIVGDRSAIPPEVTEVLRTTGLAHILAISGLHMALFSGAVFFVVRAGLALMREVSDTKPIDLWAAGAALAAAAFYLAISGASVATQRAFVMTALVLAGRMAGRRALTLRNAAIAALLILLPAPESLLDPGFQMSFAAVIALIAAYEGLRGAGLGRGLAERGGWPGQAGRLLLYGGAVFSTTVIAGLATAPFAAFHFQRVVDYGLVANLVAVPLTSFWIMPLGLLGYLLMPLGLEHLALQPMGWGIALVDRVAAAVAGWPGAVTNVPAMPVAAVVAMALGGLWLALWRRPWRLAGLVAIAAGVWLTLAVAPPDLLVDGEGRSVAVRIDDRLLFRERTALRRREAAVWARQTGLQADAPWPRDGLVRADPAGADAGTALLCDPQGCLYRRGGTAIAIPFDPDALARDCRQADAVVADFALRQRCPVPELLVDIRSLAWQGATTLRITPQGGLERQTVAARRGRRPWSGGGPPD